MRCRDCPAGRRYMSGSVMCLQYGMIISEEHRCRTEGWKAYDREHGPRREGEDETEVHGNGGRAAGSSEDLL